MGKNDWEWAYERINNIRNSRERETQTNSNRERRGERRIAISK